MPDNEQPATRDLQLSSNFIPSDQSEIQNPKSAIGESATRNAQLAPRATHPAPRKPYLVIMPLMRLQKYLSAAGVCSRRKGEEYIASGRVAVNNEIVVELGTKVDSDQDLVTVDGNPVVIAETLIYIALNKPKEYVTSCDHPGEKIVLDLVNIPQRIYPIGRLDKDSSGLLLLTSDGRLHHKLSHPSFDHEKEYDVTLTKSITDGALRKLAEGLPMMEGRTRPARVRRVSARRFRIVLQEGKNRQIRRMVRKVGNQVAELKRIRVANIRLGRLAPGSWRHLTPKEKAELLKLL